MSFLKQLLFSKGKPVDHPLADQSLSSDLLVNVNRLQEVFSYPTNNALKMRDLFITFLDREATVLFIDGATDTKTVESHILEPLLEPSMVAVDCDDAASVLLKKIVTAANGKKVSTLEDVIQDLLNGNTVILLQGCGQARS